MQDFVWPVRVYYEDTDSGGVVYYANYLKFMERARSEWLRQQGFSQEAMAQELGLRFVVRHAHIDYRRPARLDDVLHIHTRTLDRRRVSLTFEHRILHSTDNALLCTGLVQIACINAATFRPTPLPPSFMETADGA